MTDLELWDLAAKRAYYEEETLLCSHEDLRTEVWIGLREGQARFDPSRGQSLESYLYTEGRWAAIRAKERTEGVGYTAYRKGIRLNALPLDEARDASWDGGLADVEAEWLLTGLHPMQAHYIWLKVAGYSSREIADSRGIQEASVNCRLKMARPQVRANLREEGRCVIGKYGGR